jgi:hypothetical protein
MESNRYCKARLEEEVNQKDIALHEMNVATEREVQELARAKARTTL